MKNPEIKTLAELEVKELPKNKGAQVKGGNANIVIVDEVIL
jgi:hypothetical protein